MLINFAANQIAVDVFRGVPSYTSVESRRLREERPRRADAGEIVRVQQTYTHYFMADETHVGDTLQFNQLLSTSVDFNVAANFSGSKPEREDSCFKCCIYQISLPVNYPRLAIRPYSNFESERELLLPALVLKKGVEKNLRATLSPSIAFDALVSNLFQWTEPAKFVVRRINRDPRTGFVIYDLFPLNGF